MIRFYRAVAAVAAVLAALTVALILSGCSGTPLVPATPNNTYVTVEPNGESVPFGSYFRQEVYVYVTGPRDSEADVVVCVAEDSCQHVGLSYGSAVYKATIIQASRYAVPHARIESVDGIAATATPTATATLAAVISTTTAVGTHPHYGLTVRHYADCENVDGRTPCVTRDDGTWRLVTSYAPYRYVKLNPCQHGSALAHLPCVRGAHGRYLVFTNQTH